MKKRSTARNGWGLLRFGFNLRPLRVRSPPMTMTVDSFHSPGPGYHIRYQDLRGIHRAVIEGDTEKMQEIQQLLVFGLHDLNKRDRKNRTALHLACAIGSVDMVKILVLSQCQLNLRDGENRTALVKAVQCQEEACVDILLRKGADVNTKDFKDNTALHYAAYEGNISIARKLLLNKGDIEAKNKDGLTPLLVAVNEKKEKMVAFLLEEANINAVDYTNRSCLHLACANGHEDMVKLLVDRKCQLNLRDVENTTALLKAVQSQDEACVDILLKHGANPDLKDIKGNTALHYAALGDNVTIAQKLLLKKVNMEIRNKDGLTPVLVALNENKEQMVKFLVGKGARLLSGDTVKSSDQLISEHEEEMKPENSSQNHDLVAKKSEEVSLSSRTRKADTDDSRPSKHEDLSSGTKTVPKLNLRKQMAAFLRPKKAKCGLVSQEDRPLFADNNFAREDKTETLCKPSVNVSDYSPLAFVSPETPQTSSAMLGVTKSISARLPKKSVDCLPGAADQQGQSIFSEQVEDSPGKDLLHWESTTKVKDSVPNEAVATSDKQTPRSDLSSEPDLEVASQQKQEQERPDKSENNHPQDKVILQTCILAEKTSESQTKQINIPLVQLQNMAREPEMNMECDRQGDRSVHSEHPRVHKKYEEIQMKQGKLDWKNNVKRMSRELKQKIGKTCEKYQIITHPKLEPLRGNSKEADVKEIPPNVTKVTLDCEEKDELGVSVSVVPQAFPEQKEPSLENAILSHSYSGSPDYACQSSSKLSSHENDNKPGEHVFNKNESLDSDPENKKVRNPLVTFEVKEDQEFDMQMAKSLNQNTTNSKLDTGYIPPYSDPESLFDLRLAHSNVAKQMIQKKRHDTSAITNTYKKTKPIQDSFQKPLDADNDSTNNYKSTEPALENVSSSPRPFRTSKVYQKEELQQDMQNLQRFKNEKGMLQVELLALEKEKVELQKETGKERKQHTSNKMEGAENIYDAAAAAAAAPALGTALAVAAAAAAAAPAAGLIQQRKTGKTDNHLFPTTQNEDSDSNDPGLSIMEIKKDKNVKWASKASVITPGFEEADSLTGSLLRVSNDNSLSKMDQDERRPAKKTSKEKNKVKKQVNSAEHLDDEHLDDLTQSSETASEDCKLQYSDYKSSLLLIELGMDCKDSVSVLTIQNAILKYKRSIELKRKDCEQLTRKILQVEYKVNGLEQLLSETKEMKSQLEHQKVEWERELYSLRLTLKQEKEKRRSAEILYINIKEQLRSKEELSEVSPPHEKEKGLLHENRMLQDELAMLRLEIDTIRNQKQEKRYCEDTETEKEKNDSLQNAIKLNEVTLTNTVFQSSGQLNVVTTENTMLNSKLQDEKLNRERLEAKLQSYRARVATAIQDRDQSQASKRDLELAFQRAKDEWCHLQDKMNFEMSNLKDNNEVLSQQLSEVESKLNALEIELQYTRDALREKTLALEHLQRNPKQTQGQKKEIEQKSQNEQGKVNEYMGKHESLEEKLSQLQSENMLLREQLDDAYSRVECKEKTIIYLKDQVQVIVRMVRVAGEKRALQLRERNKELINKCKQIMERAFRYEDEKEERERQEAKELQTKVVRCVQKFRDDIKKLEVENAELKVTVKEQAGQIEQLQKDLLSSSSVSQSLNFCPKEKEFLYL
ncbi:ankyrin repeat domain-containing protein 36B-like isoform X10 [Canis lupus dingo]|uniref:ankyrin repeat domain-containing protein 36B-like isoform X10 n=1 Tax=Canis lupus dingo TaxID=286419 RepID=UPI0020C26131|nr:ankyrin repeat domain-containing protein 36B-like isoform X10 [Canis lupus dingo]